MLKKNLNDDEKFGLTQEEIKLAERYLRKHKTAGALPDGEAMVLFELFMIGTSFADIHLQYPQHPIGQIILTAALRHWGRDRDRMMGSLKERVKAKVVKSVVESVDFLTSMLSVATAEHVEEMHKYSIDPKNNPKPRLRVTSIKEYKEVLDALHKVISATTTSEKSKGASMISVLEAPKEVSNKLGGKLAADDPATLLAEVVEEDAS